MADRGGIPPPAHPPGYYVPRLTQGIWAIPVLMLSVLGDLSVLLFYLVAYGSRLPVLRHPLHQLIVTLFIANLFGVCTIYFLAYIPPDSPLCQIDVMVFIGSVAAEYSSSFAICWLLFHSLVLHGRMSSFMTRATLALPALSAVGFGLVTINGAGRLENEGGCWYRSFYDWRSMVDYVAVGVFALATAVMAFGIVRSISHQPEARARDEFRLPSGGVVSQGGSWREDSHSLSVRLWWYPISILICGGGGILLNLVDGRYGMVVGIQLIMLGGFVNTTVFFVFDPTARKIARGLVEAPESQIRIKSGADTPTPTLEEPGMRSPGTPVDPPSIAEGDMSDPSDERVPWGWHVARRLRGLLRLIARNEV